MPNTPLAVPRISHMHHGLLAVSTALAGLSLPNMLTADAGHGFSRLLLG